MTDPASDDCALLIIDVQNDFCPGGALTKGVRKMGAMLCERGCAVVLI